MPAPIVYEGVQRTGGGGQGVHLFKHISFWISLRVPSRTDLINNIKSNGGEVVQLEKHADMLIADHAKWKSAPANSYSWLFIHDALKKHELPEDKDVYLIENMASSKLAKTSRSAASSASASASATMAPSRPAKGGRTPFTDEDDKILTRWVLAHEKKGASIMGNKIYQELEELHPHHTYQSWRHRWVKKLCFLDRPRELSPERLEPPPQASPRRSPRRDKPPEARRDNPPESRRGSPPNPPVQSPGRTRFTAADDELILRCVAEARRAGMFLKGNNIFLELAKEHPHHPLESWRDRWTKILSKREERESPQVQAPAPSSPLPQQPDSRKELQAPRPSEPSLTASSSARATRKAADGNRAKTKTVTRSPGPEERDQSAAKLIQRIWRGYTTRKHLSSQSQLVGMAEGPRQISRGDGDDGDDTAEDEDASTPWTNKQQFYRELQDFYELSGLPMRPLPQVGGMTIDLWELWRQVTGHGAEPAMRDWHEIAEDLGIDWIQKDNSVEALARCYEETLGPFERAMQDFEEEPLDSEPGEPDIGLEDEDDTLQAQPRVAGNHTTNSSPLILHAGKKRAFEPDTPSLSTDARKRARRTHYREVPSTPEEKLGLPVRRDIEAMPGANGRRGRPSAVRDPSPASSVELPSLSEIVRAKRTFEPETQDFRYDPDTQALPEVWDEEEPVDVTPSQQLHSELEYAGAIPLSLKKDTTPAQSIETVEQSHEQRSREESGNPPSARQETPGKASVRPVKRRVLPPSFGSSRHGPPDSPPERSVRAVREVRDSQRVSPSPGSARRVSGSGRMFPPPVPEASPRPRKPSLDTKAQDGKDDSAGAASDTAEIDTVIERYVSLGYSENDVKTGILAASGDPGLAGLVMQSLRDGRGIPKHHAGIWTKEDDDNLRQVLAEDFTQVPEGDFAQFRRRRLDRLRKALEKKHGLQGIAYRRRILRIVKESSG